MRPTLVLALALLGLAGGLAGYEQEPPKYVVVDLTLDPVPPATEARTLQCQLWTEKLPVVWLPARTPGGLDIKSLVPTTAGEIWLERKAGEGGADPVFIFHDYYGDREIRLGVKEIPLKAQAEAVTNQSLLEKAATLGGDSVVTEGAGDLFDDDKAEDALQAVIREQKNADAAAQRKGSAAAPKVTAPEAPPPVSIAVMKDLGVRTITAGEIRRIEFLYASAGYKREVYGGRYVQFSNEATGDAGRVQIATATRFGGPADAEMFTAGDFLADGSILLLANLHDLGFLARPAATVVGGSDPAADAYPPLQKVDRRGPYTEYPRRTPVLVRYSADLKRLEEVIRLPWGVGAAGQTIYTPDGGVILAGGEAGPHLATLAASARRSEVIENPGATADAAKKKQEPRPDGFVLRLAPDRRSVQWLITLKHASPDVFLRTDGRLLLRRGNELYFVAPDGALSGGPVLEKSGGRMAVCAKTGAMYFGGTYNSATGLEPYRNPWLAKLGADGKRAWTAYDWSGPIVGTERFRLVSDSSVRGVKVMPDGTIMFRGWSDGGNSVFTQQPYDLRKSAPGGTGFCASIWGAQVLSVPYLVHLDPETQECLLYTRYMAYLPTSDMPNSIGIKDWLVLPSGEIAVLGSSSFSFVESQDAWVEPWYIQYRTNPYAKGKGGSFFTLFRPKFAAPRMASILPGLGGGRLAARGNLLLIYGSAGERSNNYGHELDILLKDAVQPTFGGGEGDAYVMLVDTQGQPRPPVIPAKTWKEEKR